MSRFTQGSVSKPSALRPGRAGAGREAGAARPRPASLGVAFVLLLLVGGVRAPAAEAQLFQVGGHVAQANDVFGGTTGIGARIGIAPALLPFSIHLSGEEFFPDCRSGEGCAFRGYSLDAELPLLPLPVIHPYATGGLVHRSWKGGEGRSEKATGLHLGAGIRGGLGSVTLFGEGRYEFISVPERQMVLRLGVLFGR